jgi:hypothetical protein
MLQGEQCAELSVGEGRPGQEYAQWNEIFRGLNCHMHATCTAYSRTFAQSDPAWSDCNSLQRPTLSLHLKL